MADWFRWFPGLYRSDTLHLTLEQDGLYRRAIDWYMENRRPLPDNDQALANIVGVPLQTWIENAEAIRPFFKKRGANLHLKRCDAELDRQDSKIKTLSEIGRKGAEARHNKTKDLDGVGKADATAHAMAHDVQDVDIDSEVDKDSGAIAPAERPIDLKADLFKVGKAFLAKNGISEKQAGSMLGKWRRDHGDGAVIDALGKADAECASDPISFIEAILRGSNAASNNRGPGDRQPRNREGGRGISAAARALSAKPDIFT
jgi:uncharacterized protein YdaU (DUF1376 family)